MPVVAMSASLAASAARGAQDGPHRAIIVLGRGQYWLLCDPAANARATSVGHTMTRDDVTIQAGDSVAPAEYRALLHAVEWRLPEHPDDILQAALATTWNVTARTASGELIGLAR